MKFSATILAALMGFALLASADANATESEVCRVLRAQGDPCTESDIPKLPHKSFHNDTPGSTGSSVLPSDKGFKWEICINGINLLGEQCQNDTWGNWNRPRQLTATGRDAIEVIRNSKVLASGIDGQGHYRLIVTYHGQYRPAKGRTFSCTVSADARRVECRSWSPTHRNYQ